MQTIIYNEKGIRSGWRLLAWIGLSLVGLIVLIFLMVFSGIRPSRGAEQMEEGFRATLYLEWPLFLVVFLAAVVVAIWMEDRPIASLGFLFHARWWKELAQGLGLGAGMLSGIMLLLVCLGAYRIHWLLTDFLSTLGGLLTMAALFLGLAAFEEFLHRGYLLQNLIDGLGLPAAATISCVLFAALHLRNPGENPAGIFAVLLAGILFAILAVRTRCLWMAVGLHTAWDWTHFVFGVPCSGLFVKGGLLNMVSVGPMWLSGGTAGPEGSLLSLILIGLAIFYCSRARWIRPNPDAALLWSDYVSMRE